MVQIDRKRALQKQTDFRRWSNPQAFEPAWDARAELAAQFIPAGARVLDLGCGRMALRRFLPAGCEYKGCDLIPREPGTIVCDFNAGEFPTDAARDADIVVVLGVLEYIADVDSFFSRLRAAKHDVVLSYCPVDLTGDRDRAALGWFNHFSFMDLAQLFDRHNFIIQTSVPADQNQVLMRLTPTERFSPVTPCSIAVISYNDAGNFGDRLGYHMINSLLPAQAEVHYLTFQTLAQARENYDLVVLGIGNSLFQPLLTENLFDVVCRGKAAIGIFGTQFRELIPRAALDRLLDRLDTWFARYQEDVLIYGRGRHNVVHLGDWLIDQFPMNKATDDTPAKIGDEILQDLPLDRTIQDIQRYKNVFSTRLHPLLCALTSAELVAYAEQPSKQAPDIVSGKFRSMLMDVFGRTYPEKKFFIVDRPAVARYKARVHCNVGLVRERIENLLRAAVATTS